MLRTLGELADEALALPSASRAFLAEKLLETLDGEDDVPVSKAWRKEIRRRCRSLDEGTTRSIPGDAAMADVRRSIR
jgi:putative addiction module component (TIGR02574 family)